jgi:CheY-like chemotaxis protein
MQPAPLTAILIVEDESLVAMDIVDCITEAGYQAVGPIGNLPEALRIGRVGVFDAALLDANLGGETVDELAAALTKRNIPFAFVTGYAREAIPAAFQHVPVVCKPYEHEHLKQVVRNLLTRRESTAPTPTAEGVEKS